MTLSLGAQYNECPCCRGYKLRKGGRGGGKPKPAEKTKVCRNCWLFHNTIKKELKKILIK